MAIITADDLRAALTQIPDTAAYDVKVDAAVDAANDIVERAASPVVFEPYPATATQRVVYSDGTSALWLPPYEADSLTEIRYGSSTGSVLEGAAYVIDYGNEQYVYLTEGYGYRPGQRPLWNVGPYYVTAKWGYGPAPSSVVQVALEVAINIYQTTESGGIRQYESVEGDTVILQVTGLSARQKAILDAVRHPYMGLRIA